MLCICASLRPCTCACMHVCRRAGQSTKQVCMRHAGRYACAGMWACTHVGCTHACGHARMHAFVYTRGHADMGGMQGMQAGGQARMPCVYTCRQADIRAWEHTSAHSPKTGPTHWQLAKTKRFRNRHRPRADARGCHWASSDAPPLAHTLPRAINVEFVQCQNLLLSCVDDASTNVIDRNGFQKHLLRTANVCGHRYLSDIGHGWPWYASISG